MHTQSPAELLEWVDKLAQAQESDGAAKRAVKADKAARNDRRARAGLIQLAILLST